MSLNFFATVGGTNPSPQTVSVTNSRTGALTGLITKINYTNGNGWLSASLDSTTVPTSITVQLTTGSLSVGSYRATISVSSAVASNSPEGVTVELTVDSTVWVEHVSGYQCAVPIYSSLSAAITDLESHGIPVYGSKSSELVEVQLCRQPSGVYYFALIDVADLNDAEDLGWTREAQ